MAADSTKLIIEIETILRGLDKTLRGLDQLKRKLQSVGQTGTGTGAQAQNQAANAATRLSNAQQKLQNQQQRLQNQQQRLATQTQNIATAQGRATLAAQRLQLAQQRLTLGQQRLTQAQQRFTQASQAAQSFTRNLASLGNALRSLGQGMASFGATLSIAVSTPLAALGAGIVNAAVEMDSLRRGLTTIAGSAEQASAQLERLTEIAKLPGIGFQEAIQGSIALQAVGFSAQEAEKALIQFSNAVALTGGSREQLQTVTVQLGQMAAQSKVLAADLKPIINAAPAVAVALRNAFGTVRSEEIQELGIQSRDFIEIMIRELGRLPRAAAGARNTFDNFRDTLFRAAATIGETLLPALVRLADTFSPIITGLADAFASLPAPLQSTVLVVGALAIALGPVSFIFGQLVLGLGRVLVGFVQLNAIGLLPTIANFRLLGQVMIGTASLAQGAAATAAAAAVGWAALGGAAIAVVGLIAAIATLSARSEEHIETTEEQVRATQASLKTLRAQQEILNKVTKETEAVVSVTGELDSIYRSLNKESRGRVEQVRRELGLTQALRQEIGRLIGVREQEQQLQAVTAAAAVVTTAEQVQSLGLQIDTVINRVERLRQVREELIRTGRQSGRIGDPLLAGIVSLDAATQIQRIDEAIKQLSSERLPDLRKQSDEATAALGKQNAQLQQLEQATGKSTREVLEQAKSYGLFKGDVDTAVQAIDAFRKAQISLEAALFGVNEEIIRQRLELRKLSGPADEAQKQRRILIDAAVDFARENSNTIEEAKKKLDEFADKFPEVRKAIEDEIKKRPIEEFLREITGRKKAGRSADTSIRNARQQLADAIAQVALAAKEQEVTIEQEKNAELLTAAEVGQRLRLVSYREFLETRAALTADSLDREIGQQLELVKAAKLAQARLLRETSRAGLPEAERTRRRAQAAQAEEEAIRAETRLLVLQRQRDRISVELTQAVKEAQDQQLRDVVQLEIAYGELQGRIQAALEVAVVEEFREALEELGKAQDFLNKQIEKARKAGKTEQLQQLEQARNLNQRQIEAVSNIVRTRTALAELAAAEKLVENARERQRQLEADLSFQVRFRGLTEEEAIQQRLEGERRLQASMELSKSIVEDLQQRLLDLGATPPLEFQRFIDNLKTDLLGLGELSFTEQFRLAEKEFQRIDDERLRRIADIERAVSNRNIAEAEGLLLIRRINGAYAGDLERQLELLKEIAVRSNDASLQRQAQAAEETVKDANDRLADFNRQLRSTSIDALRSGFIDFFQSLRDNTITAQERLLNLIDSVVARINEVIAENLFDELMKSLLGDGTEGGGLVARFKRFLGFGDDESAKAVIPEVAGKAALDTGAAAAAATLQTGATAAAATTTTSATVFATAVSTAATTFATIVTAAASAVAAAFAASTAAGGAGSALAGLAATGLYPATPGGVYKVVEGGYPEAVLTTDPKHAARQVGILRELLRRTRGFGGRVPQFATGGFAMPEFDANLLDGFRAAPAISSNLSSVPVGAPAGGGRFRFVLTDERSVGDWLNSSEGERVFQDKLVRNRALIRDLGGGR